MTARSKDSPVRRWGRAKVVEVFGADLRSLAAFRVVLAVLVLADLANRATDLSAHYADKGILPRDALLHEASNRWQFSLNLMNGEPFFQALLFAVTTVAAVVLLVGYRTRLANVIVWVLMLSIQLRNPLVNGNGELLLHLLLFWGIFLPLGAHWSVDRALKARPSRLSMRFLSLATVGLFAQIAFVYWFTAALKSGQEWRVDGTAIYYALGLDQLTTPIGAYLYNFPTLLEVLTVATIGLEAVGPLLLFCPVFTGPVRTATVVAFMGLHIGIWLTMDIGIFPWISAFCMVCFLPGWFWDKVAGKFRAMLPEHPTLTTRGPNHTTADLISRAGVHASVGKPSVVGKMTDENNQPGSLAVRTTAPPVTAIVQTPQDATQYVKARAEASAARETQHSSGASPEPMNLQPSLVSNLLAVFFLIYVLCWNVTTISTFTMPERIVPLGFFLGLNQSWGMFAPSPAKEDGWYVIPGILHDGQQVDLLPVIRGDFQPHEVSWEKPQYVASTYNNEHWRKYLENIRKDKFADQRRHFGRYICREWNARHSGTEELMTFQIAYMLEETLPDYEYSTPQKMVLWEHSCS